MIKSQLKFQFWGSYTLTIVSMGVKFGTEEGTSVELLELAECTKPTFAYVASMSMLRLRTDLSHRLVCGYAGLLSGTARTGTSELVARFNVISFSSDFPDTLPCGRLSELATHQLSKHVKQGNSRQQTLPQAFIPNCSPPTSGSAPHGPHVVIADKVKQVAPPGEYAVNLTTCSMHGARV